MSTSILSFTIESDIADMITKDAADKHMTVSHYLRTLIWDIYDKPKKQEE